MTHERIIQEIRGQASARDVENRRGNWIGVRECDAAIAALARVAGFGAAEIAEASQPAGTQRDMFANLPQPERTS